MLEEFGGRVLCCRCRLLAQELAPTEVDHSFGRHNGSETRTMDANDHALLTKLQGYWPLVTQRNPQGSRNVKLAAGLRRLDDVLALWREQGELVSLEIRSMVRLLEEPDAESDAARDGA
jgi:hypothetical protein